MQKRKIFYGWWIVASTSIIHFMGAGIFFYSFTAFFNPLVQEFHWSYAATSFATSFRSLESGIASPVIGFLTDRYGPRVLIFFGSIWAGVGCIALSRIESLLGFYVTFFFLSVGASMMHPIPGWTAVTHWFQKKRGLAMGILVAAIGCSGVLIPLVTWLISNYGWRKTFVIAGVGMMAVGIPLSTVVRSRPETYGYLPDGDDDSVLKQTMADNRLPFENHKLEISFTARQALRTRAFWIITLAASLFGAVLHAVVVHVMPALIDVGIERHAASSIAGSLVISSVLGRLGFGWLGDYFDKRRLLVISMVMQFLGVLIFAYTENITHSIVFLILYGPGFGAFITLRLTLQGDYFGRSSFGAIQGIMIGLILTGTMASPVFTGWLFDICASYRPAFLIMAGLIFLAIPLILMLKLPQKPTSYLDHITEIDTRVDT